MFFLKKFHYKIFYQVFYCLTHKYQPLKKKRIDLEKNIYRGFSGAHQNLVYIKNENLVYISKGI